MSHSRHHDWAKGPVNRLHPDSRVYRVTYRARKRGEEEWQIGTLRVPVKVNSQTGESYDPEGRKALDRHLRRWRERSKLEMEIHDIVDEGDEVPFPDLSVPQKIASKREYEEAERKSRIIYPGHPEWERLQRKAKNGG